MVKYDEVLENAPSDATHYDTGEGCYLKEVNDTLYYIYPKIHKGWHASAHKDGVNSLTRYVCHVRLDTLGFTSYGAARNSSDVGEVYTTGKWFVVDKEDVLLDYSLWEICNELEHPQNEFNRLDAFVSLAHQNAMSQIQRIECEEGCGGFVSEGVLNELTSRFKRALHDKSYLDSFLKLTDVTND
ncbi:hypothetical protein NVP1250O_19 [Vibrio phage 1.250.O._10N.261.55.E11]|nr:hypothetical protein NVP1250O_19 [Vibrio phage 1.250.O._10N.261.55.E11]